MLLTRTVFDDGWGLEIRWEGWMLNFHRIQYPGVLPAQLFIDAGRGSWKDGSYYGFMLYVNRQVQVCLKAMFPVLRFPKNPIVPNHDMMPLYRMCQKCRIDGGPGEPIVDWLQDKGLL